MTVDALVRNLGRRIELCQYEAMTSCECSTACLDGTSTIGPGEAQATAEVLKVLAEPSRLQILGMISGSHEGERCICDLTEPLGLSQPTVSHHMRLLREAGIVEGERRGKWVYFRLADDLPPAARAVLGTVLEAPV